MENRMKYVRCLGAILLGAAVALSGCGDGSEIEADLIRPIELEESVGAESWGGEGTGQTLQGDGQQASQENPAASTEPQKPAGEAAPEKESAASEEASGDKSKETSETTSAGEETRPEPINITISAAGDVTMGNYINQGYANSFRQTYEKQEDKSYFFKNVYDIFSQDDMTIVNLEGTLTFSEAAAPGRTYNIKGDPEYAYLLNYGSIEAVSMANNHRMDFGEEGAKDSVEAVKAAGVAYAYDNVLGTYEVEGIKIGWVSVNEIMYGTGIEKFLEKGINRLKEEGAHLILACCHWGIERENYPEDYQKEVGRKCIDWGADLVIGHHPHVLQGIEAYQGKYIIYSLGNFCFGANRNPADKDTMIFQQTFTFEAQESTGQADNADRATDGQGDKAPVYGHAQPGEARIIPCSISSVTSRNDYCPTPLTGEEGQRVIGRVNEYSRDFGVTVDEEGILSY